VHFISTEHMIQVRIIFSNLLSEERHTPVIDLTLLINPLQPPPIIDDLWNKDCKPLSQHCLSEWLVIPENPIMFGFLQFVYLTNRSVNEFKENIAPDFVCFDANKCPALLATIVPIKLVTGLTCCYTSDLVNTNNMKDFNEIIMFFSYVNRQCLEIGIEQTCTNSSSLHCNQSLKCIPYHRVGDGMVDCYYGEDESFDACQLNDSNRFICESDPTKCLSPVAIGNGFRDCPSGEDEVFAYTNNLMKLIPFPVLCDNDYNYNMFSLIEKETDESNCEWWPCNNPYTYCDEIWNCANGADELNCPKNKCLEDEHECQNEETGLSYCLPLAYIFDRYLGLCRDSSFVREL
jgi:hypothetical protein